LPRPALEIKSEKAENGLKTLRETIIFAPAYGGQARLPEAGPFAEVNEILTVIHEMTTNRTFTMIKPDAVSAGNTGAITKMIEEAGFRIVAVKKTKLSAERAGQFYAIHKERPFYNDLCAYMSSGPIVPMILEKENAVEDFRKLIGATDPQKAEPGTIRNLFAKSIEANAIHGSDSDANAEIEGSFFFSQLEQF
jgi:nucleoside-diphosphate kinase